MAHQGFLAVGLEMQENDEVRKLKEYNDQALEGWLRGQSKQCNYDQETPAHIDEVEILPITTWFHRVIKVHMA